MRSVLHKIAHDIGYLKDEPHFGISVRPIDWIENATDEEIAAFEALLAKHAAFDEFCRARDAA